MAFFQNVLFAVSPALYYAAAVVANFTFDNTVITFDDTDPTWDAINYP